MIHSSARTPHPVAQGLWGSFEVFFDTFVVCSITSVSVLLSGNWTNGTDGGTLALSAFSQSFGTAGSLLFSFNHGYFYCHHLRRLVYLLSVNPGAPLQKGRPHEKVMLKLFYAVRALPGLIWTIYLVKTNNQGFIWTVVDITSAIPTFVNVAVILLLSKDYFRLLKDYKARYLGEGTAEPDACLFYEEKH